VTTDREALRDLVEAIDRVDRPHRGATRVAAWQSADAALAAFRSAADRARAHLEAVPEPDCSAEVERASRAAYAAGQARNAGATP
jgi:hypothetical protein